MARLVRARGIRGELSAVPLATHTDRFHDLKQVYLSGNPFDVETVWQHGERWIFKFRGVDSMSAAEKLAGLEVCITRDQRAKLPDGEYFCSDLVGCRILDDGSGEWIGTVAALEEFGGPPILVVTGAGPQPADGSKEEPMLIPFAAAICRHIDTARREIRVLLPEGLKDINS